MFKFRTKAVLTPIVSILMIVIIIGSIVAFKHLKTIFSVKEKGRGMYVMENYECTNTEGLICANIKSIDEFIDSLTE